MALGALKRNKKKTLAQVARFGPSRVGGSKGRTLKVNVYVHRYGDHYDARACYSAKGKDHEFNPRERVWRRHANAQCGEFIEASTPTKAVSSALKSLANRKR